MYAGLLLLIAAVAAACFPLNAAQKIQLEHQDFSTHKLLQRVFPESSALQAECCTLELQAIVRPIKKDGLESLDGQLHVYMLRPPGHLNCQTCICSRRCMYVCIYICTFIVIYSSFQRIHVYVYLYIYIYMMQGCHTPPSPLPPSPPPHGIPPCLSSG